MPVIVITFCSFGVSSDSSPESAGGTKGSAYFISMSMSVSADCTLDIRGTAAADTLEELEELDDDRTDEVSVGTAATEAGASHREGIPRADEEEVGIAWDENEDEDVDVRDEAVAPARRAASEGSAPKASALPRLPGGLRAGLEPPFVTFALGMTPREGTESSSDSLTSCRRMAGVGLATDADEVDVSGTVKSIRGVSWDDADDDDDDDEEEDDMIETPERSPK